ncbi:hypothetical protein A2T55_04780 [Brevibacterium linens]|uniref:FAD/NAD(P)-binding domain-containing protein n=1 Tax=Brevibacterium linens TaxID=1703 RepID=A0A142NLB9_BRELN|nr:FAD-dependent oxidoreductase [Brevibacterium linens]AMT93180.1 hypothetical protein A2T55_04780 [Brevibacterium linens]
MQVIIVGAGYAGVTAANWIARRSDTDVDVTIINPRELFIERIRLHQLAAGTAVATHPLRSMLHPSIELRLAWVRSIGTDEVHLSNGETIAFNYLVYAPGAGSSAPTNTLDIGQFDSARSIRTVLTESAPGSEVTVVGGGLTGVETSAEIAIARPDLDVRIIARSGLVPTLGDGARATVRKFFDRHHISVVEDVCSPPPDNSALTVWAITDSAARIASDSGLSCDGSGRVIVDAGLRSVSHPRVIAIGDGAAAVRSRMACSTALPQAIHGASTVLRLMAGDSPKTYTARYATTNVSLGRRDAVTQFTHLDDRPTRLWMTGPASAALKEGICRFAVSLPRVAVRL